MKSILLHNPILKKLTTINHQDYYLIINPQNEEEAYFCFSNSVKTGWEDLVKSEKIEEIEIEFVEKEKNLKTFRIVKNLYISNSEQFFLSCLNL